MQRSVSYTPRTSSTSSWRTWSTPGRTALRYARVARRPASRPLSPEPMVSGRSLEPTDEDTTKSLLVHLPTCSRVPYRAMRFPFRSWQTWVSRRQSSRRASAAELGRANGASRSSRRRPLQTRTSPRDERGACARVLLTAGRTIVLVGITGCHWSESPMASARTRIILVGEMGVHAYTQGSTLVSLAGDAPSKHSGSGGHTPFPTSHLTTARPSAPPNCIRRLFCAASSRRVGRDVLAERNNRT